MTVAGATLVTGIVGNVHVQFHVIFKLKSVKDNTLNRTFITVNKDPYHTIQIAGIPKTFLHEYVATPHSPL